MAAVAWLCSRRLWAFSSLPMVCARWRIWRARDVTRTCSVIHAARLSPTSPFRVSKKSFCG